MTYNKGNKITSKEALKCLLENSKELFTEYGEDKFYLEAIELYNIVLKDLEILDILKKWIEVRATNYDLVPYEISVKNAYVSSRSCLVLTKEDYIKIKVWLSK